MVRLACTEYIRDNRAVYEPVSMTSYHARAGAIWVSRDFLTSVFYGRCTQFVDTDFDQYVTNMGNTKVCAVSFLKLSLDVSVHIIWNRYPGGQVWGGHLEMHAMADVYKWVHPKKWKCEQACLIIEFGIHSRRDFLIFERPGKNPYLATDNGHKKVKFTPVTLAEEYNK